MVQSRIDKKPGYQHSSVLTFRMSCSRFPGGGGGGYSYIFRIEVLRLLFWVKNLSESYFLVEPMIQLLSWVHERPDYFCGVLSSRKD